MIGAESCIFGCNYLVHFFLRRTGSKLGISPLMLAAMNGHTAAVKLLLDMGSDINAQIETNRNTALTLACFQGRHDVVSLLVDRKANIGEDFITITLQVIGLSAHASCKELQVDNSQGHARINLM